MVRPKRVIPTIEKTICVSSDLVARVDLELFSYVDGKVPFGAWQKYIERLIREDFARRDAQDAANKTEDQPWA